MAVQPLSKGFLGYCQFKKTAGQSTPAVGTLFNLPALFADPRNPKNLSYLQGINAAGAVSLKVAGKRTPSVSIAVPLKLSWFTGSTGANMIGDFIGASAALLDTANNSSEYAINVFDGVTSRVYDGMKCAQLSLSQSAVGGAILMETAWIGIYGDSEKGTPTTFAAYSTDGGALLDVSNMDYNSTASDVQQWRITMMRPQGFQPTCDGTLFMASVESGQVGGMYTITQGSGAGVTVPSTTVTHKIGTTPNGISFVVALSLDEKMEPVHPTLLTQQNSWTMFNSGTLPVVISTF